MTETVDIELLTPWRQRHDAVSLDDGHAFLCADGSRLVFDPMRVMVEGAALTRGCFVRVPPSADPRELLALQLRFVRVKRDQFCLSFKQMAGALRGVMPPFDWPTQLLGEHPPTSEPLEVLQYLFDKATEHAKRAEQLEQEYESLPGVIQERAVARARAEQRELLAQLQQQQSLAQLQAIDKVSEEFNNRFGGQ